MVDFVFLVSYLETNFQQKKGKIRKLFCEPFSHWPDAKPAFSRHESKPGGLHMDCMHLYTSFLNNILGKTQSVDVLPNKKLNEKNKIK